MRCSGTALHQPCNVVVDIGQILLLCTDQGRANVDDARGQRFTIFNAVEHRSLAPLHYLNPCKSTATSFAHARWKLPGRVSLKKQSLVLYSSSPCERAARSSRGLPVACLQFQRPSTFHSRCVLIWRDRLGSNWTPSSAASLMDAGCKPTHATTEPRRRRRITPCRR